MSKANRPTKVLRTALKRIQRGWTKGSVYRGPGNHSWFAKAHPTPKIPEVCLKGALHGYQGQVETPCSIIAEKAVLEAINERFGRVPTAISDGTWGTVVAFNDDPGTTFEMVEEVIKLGLIKLESGWESAPEKVVRATINRY